MIYLISLDDKFLKIGHTKNVKKRISQLQVSIPFKLTLISLIDGGYKEENELHNLFSLLAVNGEWFKYDYSILEYFQSKPCLMWKNGFTPICNTPIIGLIKSERIDNNLTLDDLAQQYGCTKQGFLDIEKREVQGRITLQVMHKIGKCFNKRFEYRFVNN